MWKSFDASSGDFQFPEQHSWIPSLNIDYRVGVDGLGLLMVMLSTLLTPMAILASWRVQERAPLYFALMLGLEAGLIGTFTALNFFHWFIFWELSLIPAFFLNLLWGGPQRVFAATQYFVYAMVGSVALLLAFLAIFQCTGKFDFLSLSELGRDGQLIPVIADKISWHKLAPQQIALIIFCGAFLGFAV